MLDTWARAAGAVVLSLTSGVAFAALMQHSETTIPLPASGEATPLKGLSYKSRRFEASITSLTVKVKSAEGADPALADWVFTASNTDGQVHRVEMQIRFLDESGKQIGWSTGKYAVRAGASGMTFPIAMKVKANVWRAAKKVRIFADWIS
ncbi:MAG: hypothetical protein M3542_12525 [Acidobacteriota bacterium]|nr:hypothetical protein [Acidobacteriota bacterium]MDQ5872628.1 hypothetical protein [Acidobacteriota bacterium]